MQIAHLYFTQLEDNGDLVIQFMDLLTRYIQVQVLLGTIAERKQLVTLYAIAFQVSHVSTEPNFTR